MIAPRERGKEGVVYWFLSYPTSHLEKLERPEIRIRVKYLGSSEMTCQMKNLLECLIQSEGTPFSKAR